ncbi:MAG: SRPBCC family protein [Hyphomicrobiaceae bacterium]
MNFENALGAEFRELTERNHNGKPARVVAATRVYPTTQEDLWDAITNKERLPRWFSPVTGNLEPEGRYKIKGNAKGKIIKCDPPDSFELTWEIFFNVSWVHVRLAPESNGTRLTLEHIMLKGGLAERHWRRYGPGATGVGWDLAFLDLGLHLDMGGAEIDRSTHDVWMKSDAGKTFLRTCAAAWGRSHIAAGETEENAHTNAAATAKFYAGD